MATERVLLLGGPADWQTLDWDDNNNNDILVPIPHTASVTDLGKPAEPTLKLARYRTDHILTTLTPQKYITRHGRVYRFDGMVR